jgi:hypothetical protein
MCVQESVPGLYRAPSAYTVQEGLWEYPPQTIISVPVQTAAGLTRPARLPAEGKAVQVFVAGLYRAPSFRCPPAIAPPQTSQSVPVQTLAALARSPGAPADGSAVHESVEGLYRAPSPRVPTHSPPPHVIISAPVHAAIGWVRGAGVPARGTMGVHVLVVGLYLPPSLYATRAHSFIPAQTIISLPVHTVAALDLAEGAPIDDTGAQVSVAGSYRAPSPSSADNVRPPQMIISVPVQTTDISP